MTSIPSHSLPERSSGCTTNCQTETGDIEDETKRENAKLQAHFEQKMTDTLPGHRKVAVLMLSWEKEQDTDIDTNDEVQRLSNVFKHQYGFIVHDNRLKMSTEKAKSEINLYMAQFMYLEDDEDTLLIIYYAGHGGLATDTANGLKLTGGNSSRKMSEEGKEIIWDKCEYHLQDAKSDMLLIFDCCHAARAGNSKRRSPFSERVYEVLGACQADEKTLAPGPDSFTTALIWALDQLATPPKAFTTSQLYAQIQKARVYSGKSISHPYWSEKSGFHTLRRLKIVPKSVKEEPKKEKTKYFLMTSFLWSDMPSEDDVTKLCRKLKQITRPDDPASKVHQILWKGLYKAHEPLDVPRLAEVAELLRRRARQRRTQKLLDGRKDLDAPSNSPNSADILTVDQGEMEPSDLMLSQQPQTLYRASRNPDGSLNVSLFGTQLMFHGVHVYEKLNWILAASAAFGIGYIWAGMAKKTV